MDESTGLAEGYCIPETVTVDGKSFVSAKWVLDSKSCTTTKTGVSDETGKVYRNGCDKTNFMVYSCNEETGEVVQSKKDCSTEDGNGKCSPTGCTGVCSDNDPENTLGYGGTVIANGKTYPDSCVGNDKIKQYQCVKGKQKLVTYGESNSVVCGVNQECVLDVAGAAYCKEKYAGADTTVTLKEAIVALQQRVSQLEERLDALENPEASTEPVTEPETPSEAPSS